MDHKDYEVDHFRIECSFGQTYLHLAVSYLLITYTNVFGHWDRLPVCSPFLVLNFIIN